MNSKGIKKLGNFEIIYNNVYVFILESKKSIKCVGWGNKWEFVSKYWNYKVYDYDNSHTDKTTTLILVEN